MACSRVLSTWQLATHPAIVVVPYTKSVMSFFELYRMNIPLFAPSLELLVQWERDHSVRRRHVARPAGSAPCHVGTFHPPSPRGASARETERAWGLGR